MIDERHEELAALYALELLEGDERARFEADLTGNPALQELVRDLRSASGSLAHLAPALPPPPELRARILASIEKPRAAPATVPGVVVRPPISIFRSVLPWAIAASLAFTAVWIGRLYVSSRTENASLRDQQSIADLAHQRTRQELEAERLLAQREAANLNGQLATTTRDLAQAQTQLADATQRVAATGTQLAERDQRVAEQSQRIDALTGASAEIGRQLGAAKDQIARLTADMKTQGDIANLKITTLASLLNNSPQALAVAVWDPVKQSGVLKVEKLPALAADKDYQLWIVDAANPNLPVDGGVFTVDGQTGERRFQFTAKTPVSAVAAFAVTLERKGGVPKAEGPFVLLGK